MGTKAIWQSKTAWVATLTAASGILGLIIGQPWIAEHPQTVAILTVVLGVVNVIIRTVTSEPIKLRPGV